MSGRGGRTLLNEGLPHLEGYPVNESTYGNHGCRCDDCRAAHAAYQRGYLDRRVEDLRAECDLLRAKLDAHHESRNLNGQLLGRIDDCPVCKEVEASREDRGG